jgi:hypothetical protein
MPFISSIKIKPVIESYNTIYKLKASIQSPPPYPFNSTLIHDCTLQNIIHILVHQSKYNKLSNYHISN